MTAALAMPWAPAARCYCAPQRLIFTLALGEDPDRIPPRSLVRTLGVEPAQASGHGALDRVLRDFGGNVALSRLFDPADAWAGFDMIEHARGMSRTYVAAFSDVTRIDETLDALRQLSIISSASADYFITEEDASLLPRHDGRAVSEADLWPWQMIGADRARQMESGDAAITAAVLDTGAARRHAELAGRLSSGFDAVNFSRSDLAQGLSLLGDYADRDTDPDENTNPHGTACLAIIGGRGARMPPGLSQATSLMPVRVLASARSPGNGPARKVMGLGALSDIDFAINRAVNLGAKVLNCSFGTAEATLLPGDPPPHAETTAYALDRGVVMVAASGNSGREERYFPAAADGVIAVGAVGPQGSVSAFTTTGPHVAICAPGEAILSPSIDGYDRVTGTSFAAPFVAGAAALIVARARRSARPMDSASLRRVLVETASPFPQPPDRKAGAGILDLPAALNAVDRQVTTASTLGHAT